MIKHIFAFMGKNFSDNFPRHLLQFVLLAAAVIASCAVILPSALANAAQLTSYVETSAFYMGFMLMAAAPKEIFLAAVIAVAGAVFVSPISCGSAAYLCECSYLGKKTSLGKSFSFAFKNYARLLFTYALYVIITVAVYVGFVLFMYNFLHNTSHVIAENYLVPVMAAWIAGIIVVMGGLLFAPFSTLSGKKCGFCAIGASFRMLFKNFIYAAPALLLGGVIWFAIAVLPVYFVLLSLAGGAPLESLVFSITSVSSNAAFWIVLIVSIAIATWFMFIYTHACFKYLKDNRR